jgi:hypothetical protein
MSATTTSSVRDKIGDAIDLIVKARNVNDLVALAGEGLVSRMRPEARAIRAGCIITDDSLQEVLALLDDAWEIVMEAEL